MMKSLMTCCAVAFSAVVMAGSAFAAADAAVTATDVAKFKEAPAQYVSSFKERRSH